MFSAMLTDAFQYCDAGFPIRNRFDGKLFNLRRLQAKSKVQTDVLYELLYASDMAKNAKTEKKMQEAMDQVSQAYQLWSHNQHEKDWGSVPVSTWKALQWVSHHSERTKIASW